VALLTANDLARIKRPDLANQPRVSIFLPYNEINREWTRYMAQARPATPVPTNLAAN
jgi:hypothetical protein